MQLDAFILNPAVVDNGPTLIAPITQPNYVSLRLSNSAIEASFTTQQNDSITLTRLTFLPASPQQMAVCTHPRQLPAEISQDRTYFLDPDLANPDKTNFIESHASRLLVMALLVDPYAPIHLDSEHPAHQVTLIHCRLGHSGTDVEHDGFFRHGAAATHQGRANGV